MVISWSWIFMILVRRILKAFEKHSLGISNNTENHIDSNHEQQEDFNH